MAAGEEALENGAALKVVWSGDGLTVAGSVKGMETMTGPVCVGLLRLEVGMGATAVVVEAATMVVLKKLVASMRVVGVSGLTSGVLIVGFGSGRLIVDDVDPLGSSLDVVRMITGVCDDVNCAVEALITEGIELVKLTRLCIVGRAVAVAVSKNCVPRVNDLDGIDCVGVTSRVLVNAAALLSKPKRVLDSLVGTMVAETL